MKIRPFANPFYTALLAVGLIFLVTVSAYGVLTVKMMSPESAGEIVAAQSGIMFLLDQYGVTLLLIELAVLGVLTAAAIGSDDYWQARAEKNAQRSSADVNEPNEP